MEEAFIRKLMASTRCAECGQRYEGGDISVISHSEDVWFLRTHCSSCHAHCLVAVVVNEGKAGRVVADLAEAEADRFGEMGALTADEVLDMHNFLEDFDGDFSSLFNR